ncbi:myotubularin-related protein 7-like isoform X1 [Centruroides sculpturatus]|uniref:myotubularin-related protein 7-like isoform X1 n=1 Tax=Centruroides sculpturatus TaxID=218467 RepID=UPI000C6CB27A|nr:myotubularin-related protein 7-like isoform X1 [Centruroides sculpturatus]
MRPCLAPQAMKFWRGMYNRFENGVHPREPLSDMLVATKDHITSLEDHIQFLQKRFNQLKEMLGQPPTPSGDMPSVDGELLDEVDSFVMVTTPQLNSGGTSSIQSSQSSAQDSGYSDLEIQEMLQDGSKHCAFLFVSMFYMQRRKIPSRSNIKRREEELGITGSDDTQIGQLQNTKPSMILRRHCGKWWERVDLGRTRSRMKSRENRALHVFRLNDVNINYGPEK